MISVEGTWHLPDVRTLDLPEPLATYAEIRGQHGQLLNLVGVLDGMKPCMDDWIPIGAMERFSALCADNGLYAKAGIQFEMMTHDEVDRVIGSNTLTTTRARARAIGDNRGSVHVFVGRDPASVDNTFYAGWYPLVVEGRATSKPWIDHIWFGQGLGYPPCCLEAFARNNNWSVNNMPYQAVRATTNPDALCNSLMRFTGLSWASHLPCSYDCAATSAQAARLRDAVTAVAPALVPVADAASSGTFLILSEWEAFLLHEARADGEVCSYAGVSLVPSNKPNRPLFDALAAGDGLEIRDDLVLVRSGDEVAWVEECRADGFAPRVPSLLTFPAIGLS